MFAYCNNNPINYTDATGELAAAFEFLWTWIFGDGSDQEYSEDDSITKALKKVQKMKELVDNAISEFKETGKASYSGTGEFTSQDDGWELYLSTQHFDYRIEVVKETRTSGFWFWKHEEVRYTATVVVHDVYNFDTLRPWEGLGNILNNGAYIYYALGGGHNYEWYATYTYTTVWEKVP